MAGTLKRLGEWLSQALDPAEREAVLGDLAESRSSEWAGLIGIAGLVVQREWKGWMDWRPWVAVATVLPVAPLAIRIGGGAAWWYIIGGAPSDLLQPFWLLLSCALCWVAGYFLARIAHKAIWSTLAFVLTVAASSTLAANLQLSHYWFRYGAWDGQTRHEVLALTVSVQLVSCFVPLAWGAVKAAGGWRLGVRGANALLACAILSGLTAGLQGDRPQSFWLLIAGMLLYVVRDALRGRTPQINLTR